jgi:glycosyltransferase involved in cell wall biosynthesis
VVGPVRVLLLIDSFGPFGGAERLVGHIAHGLDRTRFEPVVCATRQADPDAAAAARAAGIRVLELRRSSRLSLRAWLPLWRELRNGVGVVHTHKFGSNVWGAIIARLARVPVVIAHEHTWSFEGEPLRKLLDRRVVAALVDRFVAVSREDARRMTEIERIDPALIEVVPNGIAAPAGSGADVRRELGIAAEGPLIGCVTVLRPQKALEVLFEAAARVRREHPGLRVLVVGDGPDRGRLEDERRRLALDDVVLLPGARRDVADVLAALDIFVLSSAFEGSPLALLEAMAAAKPIVATAVGGVPDLIEDGRDGLLVPAGDLDALAAALLELLADPARARSLGAAAQARQRAEFTIAANVSRLEMLYERAIGEHRERRHERRPPATS